MSRTVRMTLTMGRSRDIEDVLRRAILRSPESRYALAKRSGVSEAQLSHFVRGKRTLRLDTAAKLARILRLELRPRKPARKRGGKVKK